MPKEVPYVSLTVEGLTDEAVALRLLEATGCALHKVYSQQGKARLDARLEAYSSAARFRPWLVLRDLDHDAECAPELVDRLLPSRAALMCFRIAVRAAESWLLADAERIAAFLRVPRTLVPADPENLDDPKASLVNLARKSRNRSVTEDIVPRPASGRREGPAYASRMTEFVRSRERGWRVEVAARYSPSLRRCLDALKQFR